MGATVALVGAVTQAEGPKSLPLGAGLALFGIALLFFLAFARFLYGAVASLRGEKATGLVPMRLVPWLAFGLGAVALAAMAIDFKARYLRTAFTALALLGYGAKALLDKKKTGAPASGEPRPESTAAPARAAVSATPLPAVPFKVTIIDAERCDADMADGTPIKFGMSAAFGFTPVNGMECWVVDVLWFRDGLRARSMNLTGRADDTWSRADAGHLYAFECLPCRVVMTTVQGC